MTNLTTIKSLQQILADNCQHLGNIWQKTDELQQLNKIFHATLDTDLAQHCYIAKFEQGKMALIVDSAAWATRLRYAIPDMIKILQVQPEFKKLKSMRYHLKKDLLAEAVSESPAFKRRKDPAAKQQAKILNEIAHKIKK